MMYIPLIPMNLWTLFLLGASVSYLVAWMWVQAMRLKDLTEEEALAYEVRCEMGDDPLFGWVHALAHILCWLYNLAFLASAVIPLFSWG